MKKSLYVAASAFLALAACTKENVQPQKVNGDVFNIGLGVNIDHTKVAYDGNDAVTFASGDKLRVAIAKESDPDVLIKVASQQGYPANQYYSTFALADAEAENPVFTGYLYSIVEADYADSYKTYFAFPSDAFSPSSTASGWSATVKDKQKGYADTWDGTSDAMIGAPGKIYTGTYTYDDNYGEYTVPGGVSTNLAHLFGFGKLTFAGIPEKFLSDNNVEKVVIEAVGENKNIAGKFKVDLSKGIAEQTLAPASTYSMSSTITVTPEQTTALADLTTWFVAAPGTYDVKITVSTDRASFVFERQGLVIERGKIAAPTVNLKETDVYEDYEVALASRQNWSNTFTYSNCITSSYKVRAWGPTDSKMNFTLTYPGATSSNYGYYYNVTGGGYVQCLNYSHLNGAGVVHLSSKAAFKNLESVKLGLGNHKIGTSYDCTVALVNKGDTTEIKTVSVPVATVDNSTDTRVYYFENNTEVKDGDLLVIIDNISSIEVRALLGSIVLNCVPEVAPQVSEVNVGIPAESGEIDCPVYASSQTPTVSSDADWLTVSYAGGKIAYSVTENTDIQRTATITVRLVDGEYTSEKTISVIQKSATAREYHLTITPAQVNALATAYLADNPGVTNAAVTGVFPAYGTDYPELKVDVPVKIENLYFEKTSDYKFAFKYYLESTAEIGKIQKVEVRSTQELKSSMYYLTVRVSKDGSTWSQSGSSANYVAVADGKDESDPTKTIYKGTYTPEDTTYTYFRFISDSYSYTIYQIDVYFVVGD